MDEPARHRLLFTGRGHRLGQGVEHLLLKTELEELLLIGLADEFQLVKLATSKGLQNSLRMGFDEGDVHGAGGHATIWASAS